MNFAQLAKAPPKSRQALCRLCAHYQDCQHIKNVTEKTDWCQWPVNFFKKKETP